MVRAGTSASSGGPDRHPDPGHNDVDPESDQLCGEIGGAIAPLLRPSVLDDDILSLHVTRAREVARGRARDAAHAMERGGVAAGQGRVQEGVRAEEPDSAGGVV